MAQILLDSQILLQRLTYGGSISPASVGGHEYMGGNAMNITGDFAINFTGTSLTLYGQYRERTSLKAPPLSMQVIIDDTAATEVQILLSPTIGPIYSSATLGDSDHIIKFQGLTETIVDYCTVELGRNTTLTGVRSLIVDDIDPSIDYGHSDWTTNTNDIFSSLPGTSVKYTRPPYGNSFTQTKSGFAEFKFN
ncbi:hypothetical protein H0H87_006876, partial [Tephrocybe sp. NHM501043]